MKIKGFVLLLTILMILAVTACGESTEKTTTSAVITSGETAPVDTVETLPKTESVETTKTPVQTSAKPESTESVETTKIPVQTSAKPESDVTPSEGLRFAYNQESDSYYLSWLGDCTDTTIVVPTEYEQKAVNGVSPWALSGCNSFNAIVIPDSIVKMENNVFTNCEKLGSIFCEAESQPAEWNAEWLNGCSATVYWGNDWHYVDGVPTLK